MEFIAKTSAKIVATTKRHKTQTSATTSREFSSGASDDSRDIVRDNFRNDFRTYARLLEVKSAALSIWRQTFGFASFFSLNLAEIFAKCVAFFPATAGWQRPWGLHLLSSPYPIPSCDLPTGLAGIVFAPPRWLQYTCIASHEYKKMDRRPQSTPESTTSRSIVSQS